MTSLGRQDDHHEGHGPSPFDQLPVGFDPCARECGGARTAYYYGLLLRQKLEGEKKKNLRMELRLCMVFPLLLDRVFLGDAKGKVESSAK